MTNNENGSKPFAVCLKRFDTQSKTSPITLASFSVAFMFWKRHAIRIKRVAQDKFDILMLLTLTGQAATVTSAQSLSELRVLPCSRSDPKYLVTLRRFNTIIYVVIYVSLTFLFSSWRNTLIIAFAASLICFVLQFSVLDITVTNIS